MCLLFGEVLADLDIKPLLSEVDGMLTAPLRELSPSCCAAKGAQNAMSIIQAISMK